METEETRINVTWTEVTSTSIKRTASVTPEQYLALIAEHAADYTDRPADMLDDAYGSPSTLQAFLTALARTEGATEEVTSTEYDVDTMVDHDAGEHWCADCGALIEDHCSECEACDCDSPNEPCDECGECGCSGDCEDDDESEDDESEEGGD